MGKEIVDGLEVFLLKIRELLENVFFAHPRGEIRHQVIHCEPEISNAWLAAHLARFGRDAHSHVHDEILTQSALPPVSLSFRLRSVPGPGLRLHENRLLASSSGKPALREG